MEGRNGMNPCRTDWQPCFNTPEFVAVHDGARPLITAEQISRCIQTAREYGAAASAHPVTVP